MGANFVRRERVVSAVVVSALTAAIVLTATPAWAQDSLTLNPTHGQANAPFNASYQTKYNNDADCTARYVEFQWDQTFVGKQDFTVVTRTIRLPNGNTATLKFCRATRDLTPPNPGNAPGVHKVTGTHFQEQTGNDPQIDNVAKDYTIDPPPSPSPSPSPTRRPTGGGTTTGGGGPAAASPSPPPSPSPSPSPTPSPLDTVAAVEAGGISGLMIGLIAAGAILLGLGGGWLIFRGRGKPPTPPAADADTMVS
jgi:hypothetical protein